MLQGHEDGGLGLLIGTFLVQAGGAVINNMSVLFAIGVAVGMAKEREGTPALAGLTAWCVIQALLNPDFIAAVSCESADPAFLKINNQFIGILSGLIGAHCYNHFSQLKLPDFLAFFSGKRSVAIITAFIAMLSAALLFFIWPLTYNLMILAGESVISIGAVGAGIYAFLNRLLIPIGMHHALNAVFWFDVAGISDLTKFWDGSGTFGQTGIYMTGFFPLMMFGVPGAALAMYRASRPERKRKVFALLLSAAFCSFLTGVTEPFEFAFMFTAPILYLIYALLTGLTATLTVLLPIRAGFSFSAGFIDLFFSSQMPLAQNPWFILPIGLLVFVLFYLVFSFAIRHFDLKTPGRFESCPCEQDAHKPQETAKPGSEGSPNAEYTLYASRLLAALGGSSNIVSLDNCITRIRLEVHDSSLVDEAAIKAAGAAAVLRPSASSVQVIVGTQVQFVTDELKLLLCPQDK